MVCLDRWVLQSAWLCYKQQYGSQAHEGPEHKIHRHNASCQLVRWCWGVIGKETRVVLPSCAVSCIRAHFPPPGNRRLWVCWISFCWWITLFQCQKCEVFHTFININNNSLSTQLLAICHFCLWLSHRSITSCFGGFGVGAMHFAYFLACT